MKSSVELLFDMVFENPTVIQTPSGPFVQPKPGPVHPFGPGYSLHPELTRGGFRIALGRGLLLAYPLVQTSLFIAAGTTAMAEQGGSPSSLFTGQPGVGSYMDRFMPY